LKIVFMGTGEFAVPTLEAIHRAGHHVSLVVSQPDRPQGRGLTLKPTPVKQAALQIGLPVFQPEKLRLDPGPVIAEGADVLVVVAYGQILREIPGRRAHPVGDRERRDRHRGHHHATRPGHGHRTDPAPARVRHRA
jgi:hypothetical protein